jgi:hypothetical protein
MPLFRHLAAGGAALALSAAAAPAATLSFYGLVEHDVFACTDIAPPPGNYEDCGDYPVGTRVDTSLAGQLQVADPLADQTLSADDFSDFVLTAPLFPLSFSIRQAGPDWSLTFDVDATYLAPPRAGGTGQVVIDSYTVGAFAAGSAPVNASETFWTLRYPTVTWLSQPVSSGPQVFATSVAAAAVPLPPGLALALAGLGALGLLVRRRR